MDSVGVMVSAEHIAKVIGKGGAGLRTIRETTGVKVQVQPNDGSNSARRVDLSGGGGQIAAAFQLLAAKAFSEGSATLFIPAENAGQVVGRGGDNLRKVREMCHVRLALEREPVVNAATGTQERSLTMTGDAGQMAIALRYILGDKGGPTFMGGGMPMMGVPGQGGILSQVRAASANPDDVQIHVAVPDGLAGAIIGKGGEQIKQTAASAGCRVSMSSREGGGARHAVLQGDWSQCAAAQHALHAQIAQAAQTADVQYTEFSVIFMVRKETAGAVIGKQGATMTKIRETSGAKVQLAREEAAGQRPCAISGPLQAVVQAEKMIYDIAREALALAPPQAAAAVPAPLAGGMMPGMPGMSL